MPTKKEFVKAHIEADVAQANIQIALNNAVESIQTAVSFVANVDPDFALDMIKQLNDQCESIITMRDVNAETIEKRVEVMSNHIGNSIEFDEEEDETGEE